MSEQTGPSEPADRPRRSDGSKPGRRPGTPGPDVLTEVQRWLIKSSARNVRRELEDQVRRLGGQRHDKADVWDVATTEIPPDAGEAPECLWCPICRAARRMRETGPGLPGQISGAGEAVATVVQDAVGVLDSLLARAARGARTPGGSGQGGRDAGTRSDPGEPGRGTKTPEDAAAARPDSLAGEHGPVGWKPGDRLATAGVAAVDPWATATTQDESPAGGPPADGTEGPDGHGHEPRDRG